MIGDVYHSQLVEVGRPDANLKYSEENEEAFFRAKNNYQNFLNNN